MNTAIVTGATSGIGLAVSKALLTQGWRVLLVGRSPDKGARALAELRALVPGAETAYFNAGSISGRCGGLRGS